MKFIIIGLGNFGSALGMTLTNNGHEVIGIDTNIQKVDNYMDRITHTICMDVTDMNALKTLPFNDTDVVIIAIGEDFGSSLMATAALKQMNVKKLVSRSISSVHRTVVEAIGVDEIISPEEESAERLAKRLEMKGVIDSFYLSDEYNIIEVRANEKYVKKTIRELNFRAVFNINILTIIREEKGLIGLGRKKRKVLGVVDPETVIEADDILVLFGRSDDIAKVLEE